MAVYIGQSCVYQAHVDVASFLELFAPKQDQINYMAVLHAFNGASKKLDNKVLFQIKHPLAIWKTPGSS